MQRKIYEVQRNLLYYFWVCNRIVQNFIFDNFISGFNVKLIPRKYRFLKYKPIIIICFMMVVLGHIFIFNGFDYGKSTTPTPPVTSLHSPVISHKIINNVNSSKLKIPSETEFRMNWVKNKLEKIAKNSQRWEITKFLNEVEPLPEPSMRVHIFYYIFYGNVEVDSEWKVWDHGLFPRKNQEESKSRHRETPTHAPPADIGSNFYPLIGCYSSRDPTVINIHFKQIHDAGVGVVVVSWYPSQHQTSIEDVINILLAIAEKYQLKIVPHIEAYDGRNIDDILECIQHFTKRYSNHPALYKIMKNGKFIPVFYVFESCQLPASEWREILSEDGGRSIRGTEHDGIIIGHVREAHHRYEIEKSYFDGFYTYFASNGFSYGSTWKNWNSLAKFAEKHKLLFFPSVSPGYVDTNIRPWNTALTRHRARGHYYQVAWRAAIAAKSYGVSITSFNNWPEGSQIEPAKSKVDSLMAYLDYEPEGPYFYINLTRYWVKQFVLQNKEYKDD